MNSTVQEELDEFIKREENNYCYHVKTLLKLSCAEFPVTSEPPPDSDEPTVDILSITPFRAAVYAENSYGMVARVDCGSQVHFRCTSCSTQSRSCNHVSAFLAWAEETETGSEVLLHDDSNDDQQIHQSVSRRKIPYPLPDRLKALHNQYECGHAFPDHLVPVHDPDL